MIEKKVVAGGFFSANSPTRLQIPSRNSTQNADAENRKLTPAGLAALKLKASSRSRLAIGMLRAGGSYINRS